MKKKGGKQGKADNPGPKEQAVRLAVAAATLGMTIGISPCIVLANPWNPGQADQSIPSAERFALKDSKAVDLITTPGAGYAKFDGPGSKNLKIEQPGALFPKVEQPDAVFIKGETTQDVEKPAAVFPKVEQPSSAFPKVEQPDQHKTRQR